MYRVRLLDEIRNHGEIMRVITCNNLELLSNANFSKNILIDFAGKYTFLYENC